MELMNPRLVPSALYTTFATAVLQHAPGHNAIGEAERLSSIPSLLAVTAGAG